jgi:hypothetical protein
MNWIRVTDRLPPVGLDVLAFSALKLNRKFFVVYLTPGEKWLLSEGNSHIRDITHWMPLPDFPQS